MADAIRVDSHVHLYRSTGEGIAEKEGYQVWEYGDKPNVCVSGCAGTVDEFLDAMAAAGVSKAVLVNLFSAHVTREAALEELSPDLSRSRRDRALAEIDEMVVEEMKAFNRWACDVAQQHSSIAPFVAADVNALPAAAGVAHLKELVTEHGARGVKLHGAFQNFAMSDKRLWPIYSACETLEIPIIGHSGPDRGRAGFAEPQAFGRMLKDFPRLRVVLAHLGGGAWRQALEIAELYPNAYFDCCEIIEWTGAPYAPSAKQLGQLIRDIGPERVMMGSDFPWYDLDHTVDRIMSLPVLSTEEKEGILGANAERILKL